MNGYETRCDCLTCAATFQQAREDVQLHPIYCEPTVDCPYSHCQVTVHNYGAIVDKAMSPLESQLGRSNAQLACIGRPEERHGVHCPVIGGTQGQRYGCRCDPHPASREIERGYTEFPVRGDIPPQKCGADGKSRRQRASHAIAPTGHGTLTKAPCVRLGRQDSWVRVTTPVEKVSL